MPRSTASTLARPRPAIVRFLALTFAFSSVFYALIIQAGSMSAFGGGFVVALMWCPGVAALITCRMRGQSLTSLGWRWNGKYQLISVATPIAFVSATYIVVWLTGLGGFPNHDFLAAVATSAEWVDWSPAKIAVGYVVLAGLSGFMTNVAMGLGEEIGWRGFLVPELAKVTSFTGTALISGVVRAAWLAPILLFSEFTGGTPRLFGLTCFGVSVIAMSFIYAWLRLRSGSVWTAAFLHGSHNLMVQSILTPLTTDTGSTEYVIGQFGAGLAIASVIVAFLFWRKRDMVSARAKRTEQGMVGALSTA